VGGGRTQAIFFWQNFAQIIGIIFTKKINLSHNPLFWGKNWPFFIIKKHLENSFGHISIWVFFFSGGHFLY
jgi:hypothetical protein